MRQLRRTSGYAEKSEEVSKGPLKIITKEEILEKKDKQLEKIEKHTEKLIQKSKERETKSIVKPLAKHSSTIAKAPTNHCQKTCKVSYLDFVLNKGVKKSILNYIRDNMYEENGETYSFIDTEEIREKDKISAKTIRETIFKLKKDGWFEIIQQHYSKRLIKIEKNNFIK